MEISLFLLLIAIINWRIMKAMSIHMPVPICPVCKSSNTLGYGQGGFHCTHCGTSQTYAHVQRYERDVEFLLESPEYYDHFKQCRQSYIHMGFGTEED